MFIRKLITLLPAGMMALTMAGCSRDDVTVSQGERAIRFATGDVSRAAVTTETITEFDAWGFRTQLGNDDAATSVWEDVFDASPVTVSRSDAGSPWGYSPVKYWTQNSYYRFYALWPTGLDNVEADENGVAITGFSTTAGDSETDPLYASYECEYAGGGVQPVQLTFRHLLTSIAFVGKADPNLAADGITVTLTSAKLYGMPTTGNWRSGSTSGFGRWSSFGQPTTYGAPLREDNGVALTAGGVGIFAAEGGGNDILTFPLVIGGTDDNAITRVWLALEYQYGGTTTGGGTTTVDLGSITGSVREWEAGKSYKYTFTIGSSDFILFDVPSVDRWKENEIGGDSALDSDKGND